MSRLFDGVDDVITFSAGGAANLPTGALTWAVIWRPNTVHRGGLFDGRDAGNTRRMGINPFDNGDVFININGNTSTNYAAYEDNWALLAFTKPAGNSTVRVHVYRYDLATWTHTNLGAINSNAAIASILVGSFDGGQFLAANLAVMGMWTGTELSDSALENNNLTTSLGGWFGLTPSVLWRFNQASTADPVNDVMSSGANQTAIVGTAVSADDPPGFSYNLINTILGTGVSDLGALSGTADGDHIVLGAATSDLGAETGTAAGDRTVLGAATTDLDRLTGTITVTQDPGPEPIQHLVDMANTLLACLCEAATLRPHPPQHCCFRLGQEVAHDADLYTDLCCEGLAYVSVGDIFPVVDSFPEESIVTQANQVCSFPSWAVNLRMGLVRCAPVGTIASMPSCTEWNLAALQGMYDAQSLASAACCFKQAWLIEEPGLSVVIGRNSTSTPQGGCVERFVTIQVQTTVCPSC